MIEHRRPLEQEGGLRLEVSGPSGKVCRKGGAQSPRFPEIVASGWGEGILPASKPYPRL